MELCFIFAHTAFSLGTAEHSCRMQRVVNQMTSGMQHTPAVKTKHEIWVGSTDHVD